MIFDFHSNIRKLKLDNKISTIRTIVPIPKRAFKTIPQIIKQVKLLIGKNAILFNHTIIKENINNEFIKINENISIRSILRMNFTLNNDNNLYKNVKVYDIDEYDRKYYHYYLSDDTVLKSDKKDKEGNITDEFINYMYLYIEL
jgi:hypothetical protein